ncbi:uncharacterized protein At5g39570 [Vigna unguiculata]|uniref:Uncharacterized protein n=1 Tax=Vigna unguiculata TaxID=3917 RepID=A0A4D6KM00_VIGUN|nr:uncharacterized protein At5g39570 [Vigna unguiculata]QCD76657.1 hypothetical protein DEO72_LG1g278 [Vigna unguiculata]
MSFYGGSSYSASDYGEYNFNSYSLNYDYAQISSPTAYSGYEYNQPYYGYDPSLYYAPNYPAQTYPTISYSATTYSDPKSVVYDPNYGMTHLVISYSNAEFNVPEFEEYDSTPYDGGYDIDQTYGKPLPPSDKICYPRSGSSPISNPIPMAIVPLPTIEEGTDEKAITPQNGTAAQIAEEKPQSQDSGRDQQSKVEDNSHEDEGNESEGSDHGDDYHVESGVGEGYSGGQGYENEKQVGSQYPSGYGLEAVDICESLFGYWPCLERMKKREECYCKEVAYRGNQCQENMWQGTADYLFGSPYPYGNAEDGSGYGGEAVYGYQRHYPMQAQYKQIDYNAEFW